MLKEGKPMRKKSLLVSWGLALCATGALLATGCKSMGVNMPGSRLLGWMNKDSAVAKNDPIKPPSQMDIPGPSDTEIAANNSTDTGQQYPTQNQGYSDTYPGAGASVASNAGVGAGPSSWNPDAQQSPVGRTDWSGNASSPGGAIDNQYVGSTGGEFGGGQQQFGPPADKPWNDTGDSSQFIDNSYVNQQGAPGDFNGGGQFAGGQFAGNQQPPATTPNYPVTDYPDSYPTGDAGQFPPTETQGGGYLANDTGFDPPPTQPPAGDFQEPPFSQFDSQSVAHADSTFESAPQPGAGDIIPPPSNLQTVSGTYSPGSTSYSGTVVADQRGAPQTTRYGNEGSTGGGSFQPNGGSFNPSSDWR